VEEIEGINTEKKKVISALLNSLDKSVVPCAYSAGKIKEDLQIKYLSINDVEKYLDSKENIIKEIAGERGKYYHYSF